MTSTPHRVPQVGHYTNVFIEKGWFGLPSRFIASGQKPLVVDYSKSECFSVCAGGIEAQTIQCLSNVCTILEEKNLTLKDVSKVTVFLADLNDFEAFNKTYADFLKEKGCENHKPARAVIGAQIRYGAGLEVAVEGAVNALYPLRPMTQKIKQAFTNRFNKINKHG